MQMQPEGALSANAQARVKRRFCFESIWPRLPGYLETVTAAWQHTLRDTDHLRNLDYKLRNTAWALQSWSQRFIGSIRLKLAVAREVVQRLESAQDRRALTPEEQELRLRNSSATRSACHPWREPSHAKDHGSNT